MLGRHERERRCGLFGSCRRVQHGQNRDVKAGSWKRKLKKLGAGVGGWGSQGEESTLCLQHHQEPWGSNGAIDEIFGIFGN